MSSYAKTISHYVKIASQGRELDSENMSELEDAIDCMVDEAVARAVSRAVELAVGIGTENGR